MRSHLINFTIYQLDTLADRDHLETSLWEANQTQEAFHFVLSPDIYSLDRSKYGLSNGGYALIEALKDFCTQTRIESPAIFFTSLPLGDRAFSDTPEMFWMDDCIGDGTHMRAVISTYWWEKYYAEQPINKYILMMLSHYMLWHKTGLMPHDQEARGCIFDYCEEIEDISKCFTGNGLCRDCWTKISAMIDSKISVFELAAAIRLFYKAKGQRTCFVAMPFREKMRPTYNVISECLKSLKWSVLRADEMNYIRNITDAILFGICASDTVIADLTGTNANVAYELGIAKALSKDVFLITQNRKLPFDLKDMRTCFYGKSGGVADLDKLSDGLFRVFDLDKRKRDQGTGELARPQHRPIAKRGFITRLGPGKK